MKVMRSTKITGVFVPILQAISLYCCVPETIILHGDTTKGDGSYLFNNLEPGEYELQAAKLAYKKVNGSVTVNSASTAEYNFDLTGTPSPEFSETYLDFGFESTFKTFDITNIGVG